MKLWIKISLICTATLFLIVSTGGTVLLWNSREHILDITIQATVKSLNNLGTSLSGMVGYYGKEDEDALVQKTLIGYCFNTLSRNIVSADAATALYLGQEAVKSDLVFEPETLLPSDRLGETPAYQLSSIVGRRILLVGVKKKLLSQTYCIYLVQDVTDVYTDINRMILQFIAIGTAAILAGAALIVLLVRLATRPLKDLSQSARRIARGDYDQRAAVHTRDEVGDLAQDFNAMAQAVQAHFLRQEELMKRQQLFIGGLTHEFKTPLTSIIGHSETLLYTKLPQEARDNSLQHIHEQCRWLERLTQKMLRLVTLREAIERREQPVEPLLEAVRKSVAETLEKRGVGLSVACEMDALAMDYDLMLSLLVNLVDNAAKASSQGQIVELSAYDHTIEVRDHGIGMAGEELERIVEPFYMVDRSRSRRMGGSGLGLALVKAIADAHGARLCIDSAPMQGTTAKVFFPDNN